MRVPVYESQTQVEGLPGARSDVRVSGDSFLNNNLMALGSAVGNGLEHANRAAAALYSQQVEEANRTRALDAVNQFEQVRQDRLFGKDGAFSVKGADVFARPDSVSLADGVKADLTSAYQGISDSLSNDAQRQMFASHALSAIQQSYGQTLQHEGEQFKVYRQGVNQAALDTHSNAIGLNFNNPEAIRAGVDGIKTASVDLARMQGFPESYGISQAEGHVSKALGGAFDRALQLGDMASALKIVKNFSPDMSMDALLKMQGKIQDTADSQNAVVIGRNVMSGILPRMATSDQDRAFNILIGAESGGAHFAADGSVTRSPDGALGKAQLLPDTAKEAAGLAGLPWRPDVFTRARTGEAGQDGEAEQYNHALGRAYFDKQVRDFKGDLSLAYAAYNAGPGAVREALDKSVKDGGSPLQYLPKETQAYVSTNMKAYAAGAGSYKRPTLADTVSAAEQHLDSVYGGQASADLRKKVIGEVTNAWELQDKAIKQREAEGLANGYRTLMQVGGDYTQLPAEVQAAIPPDKVDEVMKFGKLLGKGAEPDTDWSLYYKLKTNPGLLKETNLMAFRNRLADPQFKELTTDQTGSGSNGSNLTTVRGAGDVLRSFMAQAGMNPNPDYKHKQGTAVAGKVWSVFEDRLTAFEQQKGKKADQHEMEQIAARMFTRVGVSGFLKDSDKPAVMVDPAKDKVVVPTADHNEIVKLLQQTRPGVPITDRDVWMVYARAKGLL